MPVLYTTRLVIRPLVLDDDLVATREALNRARNTAVTPESTARHERWIRWNIANYGALADVDQPPYGDRAVCLRTDGQVVGVVGLVPAMGPFGQLPGFPVDIGSRRYQPQVGLFWAIDSRYQRQGYATEAGAALISFAFTEMLLTRIIATTEYDNNASIGVMRKLGMTILRNPFPDPWWFQVVGVRDAEEQPAEV